jgi:hypothetical protein
LKWKPINVVILMATTAGRGGSYPTLGRTQVRIFIESDYIVADIHGMDHFRTKLAPQPYNKLESCVSKIHTPMVMVWFGNV